MSVLWGRWRSPLLPSGKVAASRRSFRPRPRLCLSCLHRRHNRMTTLRLSTSAPCTSTLEQYASMARVAARPFNHGFMPGGRLPEDNLRVIQLTSNTLGRGRAAYRKARKLLLEWKMHESSATTVILQDDCGALVTAARMAPGLWVLNPCRTLSLPKAGARETTVAYATTSGHLIAGCELMTVKQAADGTVRFQVESRSRGAGLLGRAIFPLLAPAQHRFFREQVRCMEELARVDGAHN